VTHFRASSHDLNAWVKKTNLTPGKPDSGPKYKLVIFHIQKGAPDTDLYFTYDGVPPDKVLK
jgi:hypothetical protein